MRKRQLNSEVSTIDFFIDAAQYHYKNLKNKFEEEERPEILEENFKKILGEHKRLEVGVPITINFERGYAIPLYEFYSFISAIMASVNNIVDLKCRVRDGYSRDYAFSYGGYKKKRNLKKLPDFKESPAHDLIINNSDWIEEIKRIRDIVHHQPIQEFILAHLIFKGEKDTRGNIVNKSTVKKYIPLKNSELKEMLEFCSEIIEKLEVFWGEMERELNLKKMNQ